MTYFQGQDGLNQDLMQLWPGTTNKFSYLIALRERILNASGRLHVVSACLYHSSGEGQLQVVCNALNLGTPGLLLLGRIYYFLVLQTSLHCVFMLKGAGGSKAKEKVQKRNSWRGQ